MLLYLCVWVDKYKDQGLIVVGVYMLEFVFEKLFENVVCVVSGFCVNFLVVIDSNYCIWNVFYNSYWFVVYFVDVQGNIWYYQFGEGDYVVFECVIQVLLVEVGNLQVVGGIVVFDVFGVQVVLDLDNVCLLEMYVGYV